MTTATTLHAALSDSQTTNSLLTSLRNHFIKPDDPDPGAVCLTEVTAPNNRRRADLVHIGLWSSRGGGRIDVCELKASRSDWLRELEQPAKAEAWWPYSTAYWLVVPHQSLVHDGELPPGRGLMVPTGRGRRFKVVVKPEERTPTLTPALLVTLLTCTETVRKNAVAAERNRSHQEHRAQIEEMRRQKTAEATPHTAERLAQLERIEQALGMQIDNYPWGDKQISTSAAGTALNILARGEAAREKRIKALEREEQHLRTLATQYAEHADTLAALRTAPATQEA